MKRLGVFVVLGFAAGVAWGADKLLVGDFDNVSPEVFSFKDEKGSLLNSSGAFPDTEKGRVAGIKYDIMDGGWGGWGIVMKGVNVSPYRFLAFDLKGEKGGEFFEIGLRDAKGQERKKAISIYTDVPTKWQRVMIPLSDFSGVNLSNMDNLNFGFPSKRKGRIYVDNIAFEGSPEAPAVAATPAPAPAGGGTANKVVVDGFDRTSPDSAYRMFQGDNSQINLVSARVLYDGEYSMEIQYQLLSDRPWGSWVSALREPAQPLNWMGVDAVKLWVKGDGTENQIRFRFTESDGEIWEFIDKKALSTTRWTLVSMPISEFKLAGQPPRGAPPDLAGVKSYEIAILSPASSATSGSKISGGRIWVDLLYVTGEGLRSGLPAAPAAPAPAAAPSGSAAPAPPVTPSVSAGNVDFSLIAYTEYFFTPEQKSQVNSNVKLITTGKLGNFSARVEFGSESQEFGKASYFEGSTVAATENRFPDMEMPSYQVIANNIHPSVSLITLGNQFVDYGVDVMAPVFGFKGISAEGDYNRINGHVFALKHSQNSYTLGGRGIFYLPQWTFTGKGVYWEETARQETASQIVNGQLQPPQDVNNLKLERVAQDLVYTVNALGRLYNDHLRLETTYGYNDYTQYAEADYTFPYNPVFTGYINPAYQAGGHLWRSWVRTSGWGLEGLDLAYGYRDIGTGYKPRYRQTPTYYDDTDSDQWGHTFRVTQRKSGWVASAEYDTLRRHSNSAYYQHKFLWGLGHYGYRGIDIAFNQDYKREEYKFTSDRSNFTTDTNDKIIGTEIYVRAQFSPRIAGWVKPRQERIWHPTQNENYAMDSFQARFEFYIANNAKLFAEHKTSRYDNPLNEPQTPPFDDNYTRVSFEVTF